MSSFPGSPKLIKGGIVLIDPQSALMQWLFRCSLAIG
jgi:hypothetical protein